VNFSYPKARKTQKIGAAAAKIRFVQQETRIAPLPGLLTRFGIAGVRILFANLRIGYW
jgi:hypothetical protein